MKCLFAPPLCYFILLFFCLLLQPVDSTAEIREIRIGIPDHRGTEKTLATWKPTADYLTARIPGYHFTIIPFDLVSIEQAIAKRQLDFTLINPSMYIKLADRNGAGQLATLVRRVGKTETSKLGGVIFTRNDRTDITTLADLKGKSIISTNESAFAGWQVPLYEMHKAGITIKSLKSVQFSGYPVDRVVMAVRNGEVDAGTVRTDALEQMAAEGKIDLKEFRILNRQQTPGFPFLQSTQLYHEYIFARLGDTDQSLSRKVAAQLLLYPGESGPEGSAQIGGWTIPNSNEEIRHLMQALRLPPYENFGSITFEEALRQHWEESVIALMAVALFAILVIRLKLASERVKNLTVLEKSNAKYRALFEDAGDYILVLSQPTDNSPPVIIEANTAAFTKHGFTREEMIGKSILDLDTPAFAAKNRNILRLMAEGDGHLIFESEHRCKDGSTFPVEVSARLIQVGMEPPFVIAIERDITLRKNSEIALRKSEERFRVLFDNVTNIAVQGYAPDGTVRFWNKASVDLYGYSAAEAIGRNLVDLIIPPVMKNEVRDAIKFMFETGEESPSAELSLMRKDGSLISVYSNHTMLDVTGSGKELYCLDIDLSRLKTAEMRIEHLNRILRTIRSVDKLILGEKNPLRFIDESCKLLVEHRGYTTAMIIVRDQDWMPDYIARARISKESQFPTDDLEHLPNCCHEAMSSTGAVLIKTSSSICRNCPAAKPHTGDVLSIALRHEGQLYGCIKAVSNMTDSIDMEEKILFEDLAADISFALHTMEKEYLMAQVSEERDRIEAEMRHAQKMEAVGRLAGGIAHDFNNKLTVIICGTQMAIDKTAPESTIYDSLLTIRKAGEQSAALTRQLLAFSRKQLIAPELINFNQYIAAELKILSRMISEEIDIRFVHGEEDINITIDPSQLDQILANLAVNASDAINGTGVITIETATTVINEINNGGIRLSPGEYALLTFSDSGSGMDAVTQKNIFDPFFTTKAEGKGTGLGLSTVYGIIKQNEGDIHVESSPGKGTSFRLFFPLNANKEKQTAEINTDAIPVGSGTILIVEDNDMLLNLTREVLAAFGYRILAAASPAEACHLCETHGEEIHLLLTDIVMPAMNGRELQTIIEAMRPDIKTILMSGYTSDILSDRGVNEQETHFLPKPFTIDALQKKVHLVLHGE